MSKREMTVEYLTEMVQKSFANVDIDDKGKMCVLPYQSLVDTVDLYENKLAKQQAEIERLTEELDKEYALRLKHQFACEKKDLELKQLEFEKAELQKQVDELINESEAYDLGYALGLKHGSKDTAKEIFETIFYDCWAIKDENGHRVFDEGKIKDFAKKCYGVEVE